MIARSHLRAHIRAILKALGFRGLGFKVLGILK